MPGFLRRMQQWNGLDTTRDPEAVEEIMNTLTVDLLEHGKQVQALPEAARHQRWLQLAERTLYQTRWRHRRKRDRDTAPEDTHAPAPGDMETALSGLPTGEQRFARQLMHVGERFVNGRLHMAATARRLGMREPRLRHRWRQLSAALGMDETAWQELMGRMGLALAGLAADLLRDHGAVRPWPIPPRHRPDPEGRARAVLRLKDRLSVRPLTPAVRDGARLAEEMLADAPNAGGSSGQLVPRDSGANGSRRSPLEHAQELLGLAATIAPDDPEVRSWQIEAQLAQARFRDALRGLRMLRCGARPAGCHAGAQPTQSVLLRARLLELRGRTQAARSLLRRHLERNGRRPSAPVEASLQGLDGCGNP